MLLKIPGSTGTTRAASHFDRSIETPVPYRCTTAAKINAVAAAMSAAISHSSRWSSPRLSTLSTRIPPPQTKTAGSGLLPTVLSCCYADGRPSVHLDVKFLGHQIEHFLPHAALA